MTKEPPASATQASAADDSVFTSGSGEILRGVVADEAITSVFTSNGSGPLRGIVRISLNQGADLKALRQKIRDLVPDEHLHSITIGVEGQH